MRSIPHMPILTDVDLENADPRLLNALASLNEIGVAINRLNPRNSVADTLRLIVESAIQVIHEASAIIYTYNPLEHTFDIASRVSAGESERYTNHNISTEDTPRVDGIGMRAVRHRRRVLSYEESDLQIHPAKLQVGAKTMVCLPLVVAEEVVGVIYVYLHQARHFSQFELLMLDNFVNQAAIAIYQARRMATAQRELARKEEELNRLRRAGLLISSRLGLQETLETILQMALEVTHAHYGIFRLVDAQGQSLITRAVSEGRTIAGTASETRSETGPDRGSVRGRPEQGLSDQVYYAALPIDGNSIMGWVAAHQQPLCIHDLYAAPWTRIYYPLYTHMRMRSELAVPLIGSGGRLEGVLNLESPVIGAFSEQDSLLLQSLATQAVIAIQEARLVDALLEVAQRLLVHPCQDVLEYLARLACDLLNAAAGAIWILDTDAESGDTLVLKAASDVADEDVTQGLQMQTSWRQTTLVRNRVIKKRVANERLPLHGSLTGQAILTGRPVTSENVCNDPRFHRRDLARAQQWNHALIVPLLTQLDHHPIGAFSVYSARTSTSHFTESEWDAKVLTCLAHYATLALHNAERQATLRVVQEQHAVAETFAAVGDIAANVLHHLNNKVGTIPVRIQGIQDKCQLALAGDTYLAMNLEEIEHSAREAMDAVRENLARLHPIHPSPIHIAACVNAAIHTATLPETMRIQVQDLDMLPPVMGGKQGLTMIFVNLLENAADAMPVGGTITIRGTADAQWVEITVADDGPGIAPELHEHIFEFSNTSARPNKLGFGLWWVKTLMMRLGGTVAVESNPRTGDTAIGTTFRLRLPQG
ncbi:MAG: GAF domain-containing protein [Anaerolineae bacterium]|nr:GAF domain-containing protein [Anaerolineae bacterium]